MTSFSLRTRIALFFAAIALTLIALTVFSIVWLSGRMEPASFSDAVKVLAVIGFVVTGLIAWIALKFDENLAKPLITIAADLKTIAHADAKTGRMETEGRYLGLIGPAAQEVAHALYEARERTDTLVEKATREAAAQKERLESLLRDLHQGIVMCTMTGRVTLYNQRALALLSVDEYRPGDTASTSTMVGSLGLGRDIFNIIEDKPLADALKALTVDVESGNPLPADDRGAVPVKFSTLDRAATMRGHLALRLNTAGSAPEGFVIVFDDASSDTSARSEQALRDAVTSLGNILATDDLNTSRAQLQALCTRLEKGAADCEKPAIPTSTRSLKPTDARPEFYDFDLFGMKRSATIADIPLRTLHCVVFDCEMTGLDPSRDEIVSIAGVRIVNGRVLTGETFNAFVNPGRPIPPASTKVHHITDAMVADAPPARDVLRGFHGFAADHVLVAHNAAFDMAFLARRQREAGVTFDNTVLDTVLLAAHFHGATGGLTLDNLAERFQITIDEKDRHTALGDALATAHVFAKLITVLEADGIRTVGDALAVSEKQSALRRRQKAYT